MATVPKQLATPEDTFTALALQFNFEQRIKDKIIELGIRTIAEFRHYARSEDEIKKLFIDTVKDPPYEEMPGRLQAARLRFAWTACKALLDSEHAAASLPPAPTEEETLLPKQELEQLKEAFFRRYHLRPEPRQYPSDRLLSKLSRQLTRSQFEVMDLWTVRSLTFQRTHSQKRRRLTGNLYLQEDDEDEITAKSWLSYMAKMDTYFLALAIVGCRPVGPAPSAPESLGADSVQYVQVPYDILLSYSSRCHDLILRTSEGRRLQLWSNTSTWKSAVNGQPDAPATRHLAMLSVPSCGSVTPFGWPGPCQPPASPRVPLLAARHPPRPPLRMQGRWGQWFPLFVMARSFVRPTSAISAAPRRTAHVGRTAAESCCSQDGSADRTSTHLPDAPRLLEKRAAPLLGGGEACLS